MFISFWRENYVSLFLLSDHRRSVGHGSQHHYGGSRRIRQYPGSWVDDFFLQPPSIRCCSECYTHRAVDQLRYEWQQSRGINHQADSDWNHEPLLATVSGLRELALGCGKKMKRAGRNNARTAAKLAERMLPFKHSLLAVHLNTRKSHELNTRKWQQFDRSCIKGYFATVVLPRHGLPKQG